MKTLLNTTAAVIIAILAVMSAGISQAAPINILFSGTIGSGGPQVNGSIAFDSNDLIVSGGGTFNGIIGLVYTDPAAVISYTLSHGPFPYTITTSTGPGGALLTYTFNEFNLTRGLTISSTYVPVGTLGPNVQTTNLSIEATDLSVNVYRSYNSPCEINNQTEMLNAWTLASSGYREGVAVGGASSVPAYFLASPSILIQAISAIAQGPNNTVVVNVASFAGTNNMALQWATNLTGASSDFSTIKVPPPGPVPGRPDLVQWTNLPPGYYRTVSQQQP